MARNIGVEFEGAISTITSPRGSRCSPNFATPSGRGDQEAAEKVESPALRLILETSTRWTTFEFNKNRRLRCALDL